MWSLTCCKLCLGRVRRCVLSVLRPYFSFELEDLHMLKVFYMVLNSLIMILLMLLLDLPLSTDSFVSCRNQPQISFIVAPDIFTFQTGPGKVPNFLNRIRILMTTSTSTADTVHRRRMFKMWFDRTVYLHSR